MAGVNNLNVYVPVNHGAGSQNQSSAVTYQKDKTEDSFGQIMKDTSKPKDTIKKKDKEDTKPRENANTQEKKPEEEKGSDLQPGEVVPLAELGLPQTVGEIALPVGIFGEAVLSEEAQGNSDAQQAGVTAAELLNSEAAEGGLVKPSEEKASTGASQPVKTEVPTENLPKPQTDNKEIPLTAAKPQSEAPKAGSTVMEQQMQVTETAGKEVPTAEIKQASGLTSTAVSAEQAKGSENEFLAKEAEQTTEAGQVKTSDKDQDSLDIRVLQQMMKDSAPVQPQTEEVVRIKVAEPFNRADDNLVKQLGDNVTQGLLDGKKELTIQLNPEHLGKISIKISIMDAGVKVLLACDNQKTLGLLSERSDGIGHIIENNMKSPVVVEVKEDNFWNQQKNATDQHANQNGRQQEESKDNKAEESDGFLQQMRLGLLEERQVV